MRRKPFIAFVLVMAFTLAGVLYASADEGAGRAKLGYVWVDEVGNRSVYQETYNIYEGVAFSLEDAWYTMDNGLRFRANLLNMSLENRNLTFSMDKSKRFSLSLYDNKYQRIYESNAHAGTKREALGGYFSVSPVTRLKLFVNFDMTNKEGETYTVHEPMPDPVIMATDFRHASFKAGAEGYAAGGNARAEYQALRFEDKAREKNDREANVVRLMATLPVPRYTWFVVSGGYNYRQDKMTDTDLELRSDLGWGAAKIYMPQEFLLDYRFVYGKTKHEAPEVQRHVTEDVFNTVALSKSWVRRGGLRVGYDNRWESDRVDTRKSNGFLFDGWFNQADKLFLRAMGGMRKDNDDECTTLIGDQEFIRYQASAKYSLDKMGDISVEYQGRDRKREELSTQVNYDVFSAELAARREKYGRLTLSYAYYLGTFQNLDGEANFADHVVTARIVPATFKKISLSLGGVYFASKRDLSIEKFGLDVGVEYSLPKSFGLQAKYTRYDYEDYQLSSDDYFSDVVEVYIVRDLTM